MAERASTDLDRLFRAHDVLSASRAPWLTLWQKTAELVSPHLDGILRQVSPGQERGLTRIFDSMPMQAVQRFAAGLEASLIPRGSRWHNLSTGDPDLDDDLEIRQYLEKVNAILWTRRYRPRSMFPTMAQEYLLGLGTFGTSAMLLEDVDGLVRYRNLYLGNCYFGQNADGRVNVMHRDLCMSARNAVEHFGEDCPKEIEDAAKGARPDQTFNFIHAISPRADYDPSRLDRKGMAYNSAYVWKDGKEDARLVREDGYHEFPVAVSRYFVAPEETYGRSAAMFALADIRSLQALRYVMLEQANLAVDPPLLMPDDDALSEYPLEPGTRLTGGVSEEGQPLIHPLQIGARLDFGAQMVEDIRNQIDNAMLGQFFRALVENPQMTATQALLLAQQSGSLISPILQRQHSEFLAPVIRREAAVAYRAGALPEVPARLADYLKEKRQPLDLEFESPVTKALKSGDALAAMRTFESLSPLAGAMPDIFAQFDPQTVARIVAEGNGMPASAIREPEQVEQSQAEGLDMAAGMEIMKAVAPAAAKSLAGGNAAKV